MIKLSGIVLWPAKIPLAMVLCTIAIVIAALGASYEYLIRTRGLGD
jgi:hypothetical protein